MKGCMKGCMKFFKVWVKSFVTYTKKVLSKSEGKSLIDCKFITLCFSLFLYGKEIFDTSYTPRLLEFGVLERHDFNV